MATEEKLQYFYDSTITALKATKRKEIEKMRASLEQELENYKKVQAVENEAQERQHKDEIKRELLKKTANEKLKIRRSEAEQEAAIKEKLFEEVGTILDEFRKTPEYSENLKNDIKKIIKFAKNDEVTIYICPSDAYLKEQLEKETGRTILVSDVNFNGGVQAEIPSKNIFINNSYSSRMAEAKEAYIVRP